jgi:hypothetical protein
MRKEMFLELLQKETKNLNKAVSTQKGDWIVKGFIDIAKNIYTISADTKVISKIMEILLLPQLLKFADTHGLKVYLAEQQNFYPDITFIDKQKKYYAVDLKTTYRKTSKTVNGMTLGAFTGYFRSRDSKKNISFPYNKYSGHFVLGLIYSQVHGIDEKRIYRISELQKITSVITDFNFFVHEKYKIATDRPGSGNTKNIGSVIEIDALTQGKGPFSDLGEDIFDDFWMYYLTSDMARAADLPKPPYRNLKTYSDYRGLKK